MGTIWSQVFSSLGNAYMANSTAVEVLPILASSNRCMKTSSPSVAKAAAFLHHAVRIRVTSSSTLSPKVLMTNGCMLSSKVTCFVTVSPSPQSKDEENEKLHKLREYARDFRRQHTTDAEQFDWDSDDGDYGLAIGRLVVT
jgi:hypothetical protein